MEQTIKIFKTIKQKNNQTKKQPNKKTIKQKNSKTKKLRDKRELIPP